MKKLGYPSGYDAWIWRYYSVVSEWDKTIIADAFRMPGDDNGLECVILVATDKYGIGINNPDIRLIVQCDVPISFDVMIQRMGRVSRKGESSTFVLLKPKKTQVKDPTEMEDRVAKKRSRPVTGKFIPAANLSNPSFLGQRIHINEKEFDTESLAPSDNEVSDNNLLTALWATETDEVQKSKKEAKRSSKTDAEKRAKLPDDFFDYIHVACCR